MKKYIIFLFVMLVASEGFGQGSDTTDLTDSKIDSLTKVNLYLSQKVDSLTRVAVSLAIAVDTLSKAKDTIPSALKADTLTNAKKVSEETLPSMTATDFQVDSLKKINDSLSNDLRKYLVLYAVIKEKVIKHDFDPTRMSQIIDSLAAVKDSTISGLNYSATFLTDSLSILNAEIKQLKAKIGRLVAEDAYNNKLIVELKQLKELFDMKIITQSEFDIKKAIVLQKWH